MSDSKNLVDLKTAADLEEFIKKNKKVMVEYFMEWCGPCRMVKHKYIVSCSNCLHSIYLQPLIKIIIFKDYYTSKDYYFDLAGQIFFIN